MYLEDVCVRYYRAVWLAVSPFAIITCDYGINDSLRGWFCPDVRHLLLAEPPIASHCLPGGQESMDMVVRGFVCACACV